MFKQQPSIEFLNALNKGNMCEWLGIEFVEAGQDYIVAKMPVDHRTKQPMGLLHGGASVVLAETLGSVAGICTLEDIKTHAVVGLEINANHIRSVKDGYVTGKVTALHVGRTTQVWEIKIKDENDKLVCVSRITLAVVSRQ